MIGAPGVESLLIAHSFTAMSDEIKPQETESSSENSSLPDDRTLSEQNLDALDALPSSRRRSAIILGVAGTLFAFCLIILIIMPPLSWKSEKKKQSNYRVLTEISQVEAGPNAQALLRYEPIIEKTAYRLKLNHSAQYEKDVRTEVLLEADVVFTRPKRRESEDAIMAVLEDVHVKVLDGTDEVKLASIGEMLADIGVYSRLGAQDGLFTVVPEANINPQVARVLYVFADVIRQIWIPLPEEPVGNKGQWHFKDTDTTMPYFRDSQVSFEVKGEHVTLDVTTGLFSQADGQQGNGKSHIELRNGRVIEAEIDHHHNQKPTEGSASSISFHAEIHAK